MPLSTTLESPHAYQLSGYLKAVTAVAAGVTMNAAQALPAQQMLHELVSASKTVTQGHGPLSYVIHGLPQSLPIDPDGVEMNPHVQSLTLLRPAADLGAIQQLSLMARRSFSAPNAPARVDFETDDDEAMGPILFMNVHTTGMDIDEQMRREVNMREAIEHNARLSAAKHYIVLNVY